jgi:hypothetical protein
MRTKIVEGGTTTRPTAAAYGQQQILRAPASIAESFGFRPHRLPAGSLVEFR